MARCYQALAFTAVGGLLLACPRLVWVAGPPDPVITEVVLNPARDSWRCADDDSALAGQGGDLVEVTGADWDPADVMVAVNGTPLPQSGEATATTVRALLPPQLPRGPVTVRSRGRTSQPHARQLCVAVPEINQVDWSVTRNGVCASGDAAIGSHQGDQVTLTGRHFQPADLRVRAGNQTLPVTGTPTETQVSFRMPARLDATSVQVETGGQVSAPSQQQLCVVQPYVTGLSITASPGYAPCAGADGGVPDGGSRVSGLPGDTLVIQGGAWDPQNVMVELGGIVVRPTPGTDVDGGAPSDGELRLPLPPLTADVPAVIRSPGQDTATSTQVVHVERPTITALSVSPTQDALHCSADENHLALPAFAGNLLSITGCGWDPADVQVVLDESTLTPSMPMPASLSVPLPSSARPSAVVVTSRGQSSQPSAQMLCVVGPGHLVDPSAQGPLEPQLAMVAAGTPHAAGLGCTVLDLSSGTPINAADCGPVHLPAQTLAVAFSLGAYPDVRARVLVAATSADPDQHQLVALPPLADGGEVHFITDIRPFADPAAGGATGLAISEIQTDLQTYGSTVLQLVGGNGALLNLLQDNRTVGGLLRDLDVGNQTAWTALQSNPHQALAVTAAGPPGTGVALAGDYPAAAGVMERGWLDSTDADRSLLELACAFSTAAPQITINQVTDAGAAWFNGARLMARPSADCQDPLGCVPTACGASSSCGKLAARLAAPSGWPAGDWPSGVRSCVDNALCAAAVLPCAAGGACILPINLLRECSANATCRTAMGSGNPANCPTVAGCSLAMPDLGNPQCLASLGCQLSVACQIDATAVPYCPQVNLFRQVVPLALNECTSADCVAAVGCAATPQCRADARCAAAGPAECEQRVRCFDQVCSGDFADIMPLIPADAPSNTPALSVLSPRPRFASWSRAMNNICMVDLTHDTFVNIPTSAPVHDVIATPFRYTGGATVMALPAADPPAPSLHLFQGSRRDTLATRKPYRFLRPDPLFPTVYAVPFTGQRVDVLDAQGQLLGNVSVLGELQQAIPLPPPLDLVLLKHSHSILLVDPVGQVLAGMVNTTGAVPVLNRVGIPTRMWFVGPPQGGSGMLRLMGHPLTVEPPSLGVDPQDLLSLDLANTTASDMVYPVLGVGRTLLLIRFTQPDFSRYVFGVAYPPDDGVAAPPASIEVRWSTADTPGLPAAWGNVGQRLVLLAAQGDTYALRIMDLAMSQPSLVYRTRADGSAATRPVCDSGGQPQGCVTSCTQLAPNGECPQDFPVAQFAAVLPSGAVLGLFYDGDRYEYELAGITPTGVYTPIRTPPPFAARALAASPDGRRLYAAIEGAIAEMAVEELPAPPWFDVRVLGTIPMPGTAESLFLDATGSRMLYSQPAEKEMVLVE